MSKERKLSWEQITNYILIAIPLAMGIATVVLSILTMVQPDFAPTDMSFALGLGLTCLAIYSLDALENGGEE